MGFNSGFKGLMRLRGLKFPNIQFCGFPFGWSEVTAARSSRTVCGHSLCWDCGIGETRLGQKHGGQSTVGVWKSDASILRPAKRGVFHSFFLYATQMIVLKVFLLFIGPPTNDRFESISIIYWPPYK